VTKYLTETIYGRKGLFWLTVSEDSIHGCLAPCAWAENHGSISKWKKRLLSPAGRKQRIRERCKGAWDKMPSMTYSFSKVPPLKVSRLSQNSTTSWGSNIQNMSL
jgi:hypothetical protein